MTSTNIVARGIAPYAQEALLIDIVSEMKGERIACTSPGLAQFAAAVAGHLPHAEVSCVYLDQYRARLAIAHLANMPTNVHIECCTDLATSDMDVVALPFSAHGEAELTREFIQAGHQALKPGGKLYTSTDNPRDRWLGEQLRAVMRKVEARPSPTGVLYVGTKTESLKKVKDFSCEFAFRDRDRLIRAFSRPGVFSHRHVDPGARRLIKEMQIEPNSRVLDIGCGAGTVALAAAFRAEGGAVHAVDSNSRAIQCTEIAARLNGLGNVSTELNAAGNYASGGSYDLALCNPPYYASFRIARHFLESARAALRPGGQVLVVTKCPKWYEEHMPHWFDRVTMVERKGYVVVGGMRG